MNQQRWALIGLFATTIAWGASFFLMKAATGQVGVLPFVFWRLAISVIFLSLIFPKKIFKTNLKLIWHGAILGFLLFLIMWTQICGIQTTTATRSGFLTALYVPLIPLFSYLILRQKMSLRQFGVAVIAVLGLYILTSGSGGVSLDVTSWWRDINTGDAITLLTALFCALQIVVTEKYSHQHKDSIALGLWQFIFCLLSLAVVNYKGVISDPFMWDVRVWPTFALNTVVFIALAATVFGFTMQIVCQKMVGSLKAGLIFALEAPFSMVFAFLFLSERLSTREAIGAGIVFLTSVIPEPWLKSR